MQPDHFAGDTAQGYDDASASMSTSGVLGPTVDCLADLAGAGPALEFGIGTGRVALPLARLVEVHGIDLSSDMLAVLAGKPGADDLTVVQGDMASTRVAGRFSLVYLVFNTLMNLTTQDEQVACFANAAAHLQPGGRFVVEVMVPALQRLPPGDRFVPFEVSSGHVGIDEYDVVTQALVSHHVSADGGAWQRSATPFRYVWPAELDLMARLTGLRLEHRWAGFDRSPFTGASDSHVSVWQLPTG